MPGSTGGGTLPVPKKTNGRRKSGGIHAFLTSLLTDTDQRTYEVGAVIELTQEHAHPLLECGAIAPEFTPVELAVNPFFAAKGEAK